MQQSWRTDRDKLTFISCLTTPDKGEIEPRIADSADRMIGDVNLFLVEDDNEEDDDDQNDTDTVSDNHQVQQLIGEIEIMIARKDLQRRGYGRATLSTFLWYVFSRSKEILDEYAGQADAACLRYLRVKIGSENARSISLFESVGFFKVTEQPNYFGELELRLKVTERAYETLRDAKGFEVPESTLYDLQ